MKDDTHQAHSYIPTRRIWNDNYGDQIIFGELVGLQFPDICLTGEEKPRKKPHPGNLCRPGIEPGPAAWQVRMLPPVPQWWTGATNCKKSFKMLQFFTYWNIVTWLLVGWPVGPAFGESQSRKNIKKWFPVSINLKPVDNWISKNYIWFHRVDWL